MERLRLSLLTIHVPPAHKSDNNSVRYLCKIPGSEFVINGLSAPIAGRGAGSFCNHSDNPNCHLVRLKNHVPHVYDGIHKGVPVLGVQALHRIQAGDELTVQYPLHTLKRMCADDESPPSQPDQHEPWK